MIANPYLTSVQLVGRDPGLTDALARLMELDGEFVVTRTSTTASVGTIKPDVLVYTDEVAALGSGLERAKAASPATTIALLEALRDLNVGEFLNAIKAMSPVGRHLKPVPGGLEKRDMRTLLSERELEVVRLVAEGLSNKEISSRLTLSDKTVKNHISHILAKLNLTARTQVAVMALRVGIAR